MSNKFKILLVFNCINKYFICVYSCLIDCLLNCFTHTLQTVQGFDWYAKLFSVNDLCFVSVVQELFVDQQINLNVVACQSYVL